MMPDQSGLQGDIQAVATMENSLASSLTATSSEVAHSEYLSVEQRSEVYSILEALRADTEHHKKAIRLLAGGLGKASDA
ncbi:MAG: hypothetical protein E4H17_02105 [Gemmatimonadales bacterium]|nr:MAG: hypothetical protein E4H17_02105 [Gemmatimonadales bacterium]